MITEFKVEFPQVAIHDLQSRIRNTRWTDSMDDSGWKFGADMHYLRELAEYWLDTFNWRKVEDEINSWPNYIAQIDGINIHFLHIRGKQKSLPLLITHGWPGSFLEMMKVIPLLYNNDKVSFDLIIPSIPGFGFSQKVTHAGCNSWFIADLWTKLCRELGYDKVLAQGGDFGASISTAMALKFPGQLCGLHLNYIPGSYKPFFPEGDLTAEETTFLTDAEDWYAREGAYSHQHRTKPLTLAYALHDSPIGLCAWIIEKYYGWSDCNGNLENVFSKDELLANVTLYWLTGTIHSSIRLYNENSMVPMYFNEGDFINVPTGIARFHKEEPFPPRSYIERGYNLVHWSDFSKGGHFAAMEQPGLLSDDIIRFGSNFIS